MVGGVLVRDVSDGFLNDSEGEVQTSSEGGMQVTQVEEK